METFGHAKDIRFVGSAINTYIIQNMWLSLQSVIDYIRALARSPGASCGFNSPPKGLIADHMYFRNCPRLGFKKYECFHVYYIYMHAVSTKLSEKIVTSFRRGNGIMEPVTF